MINNTPLLERGFEKTLWPLCSTLNSWIGEFVVSFFDVTSWLIKILTLIKMNMNHYCRSFHMTNNYVPEFLILELNRTYFRCTHLPFIFTDVKTSLEHSSRSFSLHIWNLCLVLLQVPKWFGLVQIFCAIPKIYLHSAIIKRWFAFSEIGFCASTKL